MEIDKRLIKQCSEKLLNRFKNGHDWCNVTDKTELSDIMTGELMGRLWKKALTKADAFSFQGEATVAEAAVAACMRAGICKDRIICDGFRIFILLPNHYYVVDKEISGFTVNPGGAMPWCNEAVGFSKEQFVDFIFGFDALVPDIKRAVKEMMVKVEEILLERKKAEMVRKLQETTAKVMVDDYLNPLDISCTFTVKERGMVCLALSKDPDLFGYVEIPFDKLKGFLQDTDRVMGCLKRVNKAPRSQPGLFTISLKKRL